MFAFAIVPKAPLPVVRRARTFPRLFILCAAFAAIAGALPTMSVQAADTTVTQREAAPEAVTAWFKSQKATVLTFIGYSGAGYEDPGAMLAIATRILNAFDPRTTLVNIGGTAEGIGAVYDLAKQRGFRTTGIVSTQARESAAALSTSVDTVFFIRDKTWGGLVPGKATLSPTSQAMVASSDVIVAIGGGDVGRDEFLAARRAGRDVRFFPADMNHAAANDKAGKRGQAPPTDYAGALAAALDAGGKTGPPAK